MACFVVSGPAPFYDENRRAEAIRHSGIRVGEIIAYRAWRVIESRPLDPPDATLESTLHAAALLFDAGLYFEVHELLEPRWLGADGRDRTALQGLIQVAVVRAHLKFTAG